MNNFVKQIEVLEEGILTERNFFAKLAGWGLIVMGTMELIVASFFTIFTVGIALPFFIPAFVAAGVLGGLGSHLLGSIKDKELREDMGVFIRFVENNPKFKKKVKALGYIDFRNPTKEDAIKIKELAGFFKANIDKKDYKKFGNLFS